MAKKQATRYVCTNCGASSSSWAGRCAQCGEWNTLEEQLALTVPGFAGGASVGGKQLAAAAIDTSLANDQKRLITHFSDVDDVLGGGFVPGSINLIAGQPGIGKSTLLLQIAHTLAAEHSVLYVSGEESAHQYFGRGH
jgi:DNA repair protein RadA/Sms